MTITEKILAAHSGKKTVAPGEIVEVVPDLLMSNDLAGPIVVKMFGQMGAERVVDPDKVVLILDHFTPCKDIAAAKACQAVRDFAQRQGIRRLYDAGFGIEHVVLPEMGLVRPGALIIGSDSHTTTYGALGAFSTGVGSTDLAGAMALGTIWLKVPETIRFEFTGVGSKWIGGKDMVLAAIGRIGVEGALYAAMEFGGDAIRRLPTDGRLTMCNMAIEAGAKAGIVEPDEETVAWYGEQRGIVATAGQEDAAGSLDLEEVLKLRSDPSCKYLSTVAIDLTSMEPQVAAPHLPSNVHPVSLFSHVAIDQVVLGSCTNGRISDLRMAATVLKGHKVQRGVRALIIPGSQRVYKKALAEGLLETFIDAGAIVCAPTCGPCFGSHTGVLGPNEKCVTTTNRNFLGRMGHETSELYLAGPAVAAASAVLGRVAHPEEVSV